jgi:site-specific DNA-methyltransferase (adenine-specific)/modification methylase
MRVEQIGDCTLYLADCLEVMKDMPYKSVDCVVTDPPYGIGNWVQTSGNVRGRAVTWNDAPPPQEYFEEMCRVSKERVIWGANYFNCFSHGALVWVKNQPMPDFSGAEIASTSWGKKVYLYNQTWTNFVNTKTTEHPCERPVSLYEWCIEVFPVPPRSVLDPFMGSGTTGVACVNLGRKFIGVEIDPDYFEIACRRVEEAYQQPRLFEVEDEKPEQVDLL